MISLQQNISLKPYNTFGIDAKSYEYTEVRNNQEVEELLTSGRLKNRHLILSGGSNVLFTKDFKGIIIRPLLMGIEVIKESNEFVYLRVGSGVVWDDLVAYCVNNGWGGIENLSNIPGLVGASPIQNIGAYGMEVKDTLTEVEAYHIKTGERQIMSADECQFGYRQSFFKARKGECLIASVTFRLSKKPTFNIRYKEVQKVVVELGGESLINIRQAIIQIRQSKLPQLEVSPNGGSFFQNPIISEQEAQALLQEYPNAPLYPQPDGRKKLSAGWLIEQAGWKGKKMGQVGVHKAHALILINLGNATGQEVYDFSTKIIESVQSRFNIALSREINIV